MSYDDAILSIRAYVDHGVPPGQFLTAVLTNDLFHAVGRADPDSLQHLQGICRYIYNDIPLVCWGSHDRVATWLEAKYQERKAGAA